MSALIPELAVVYEPLETYLVVREADGDRELTATEYEYLYRHGDRELTATEHEYLCHATNRIEALEAALKHIIHEDTCISYDGRDREYGSCAEIAIAALDKGQNKP